MARRKVDHLLIGGGLAAANCARWLREEGGEGSILLVGREPDPPYNRPPLTKGYLRGKESREDALFRPDEWWGEQDIELLTRTSVMKLDTDERVAHAVDEGGGRVRQRRCSPRARTCGGCGSTAASSTASTTCAPSANSDALRGRGRARRARRARSAAATSACEVAASLTAAHGVQVLAS